MPNKSLSMEMGNLVCRFGDHKVLLDLIEEVVIPSFLDNSLKRSYNKTSYFFHETSLVVLFDEGNEKIIGIAGRFIKDTTLVREQIFEQKNGLVQNKESMRSSPSSMFLLILNNHRLIYVKETKDAPSKETFRSTLLVFLRNKHKLFIDNEFKKLSKSDIELRKTKIELYELNPRPSLELIPLTSEDSIEQFVKKYNVLKTMEISLSDRNDENDNDPFFDELQKRKDAVGSKKSIVKHSNSKGLNKDSIVSEISEATTQGNQKVTLNGIDNEGDFLRGNNEQFQLRKPLENLKTKPEEAASQLYESFLGLVNDGLINVPVISEKANIIIKYIASRLF